ncbi:MAG TPA: hypothetical protein VGM23_17700 [Armatimonadota bacterium]
MPTYYAITRRQGRWEYVCAGPDPDEVYRQAESIIESEEAYPVDEEMAISPETEQQIDRLRVITEEAAQDVYHIIGKPKMQA